VNITLAVANVMLNLNVHSDARPYKCYDCEECFKNKKELRTHVDAEHLCD
jgi:hypothetical protein